MNEQVRGGTGVETTVLFYKIDKEEVESADYILWAYSMIEAGVSSPSLFILAAFRKDASIFEVEDYFKRACRELHVNNRPDFAACARSFMKVLADDIAKSEHPSITFELASRMFHIVRDLEYPKDLMVWYDISESIDLLVYDPFHSDMNEADLISLIKREAASYQAGSS